MKEFIDKLIGRLEEEKYTKAELFTYDEEDMGKMIFRNNGIDKAIEIVNQLAEEYKPKTNDAWKIIYNKVCNLEKEYATKGNMASVNDCIRLENLLQYFKEELQVAEEYNNGWIPCSERLPKQYDYPEQNYRVLASCTDGIVRNTTIKSLLENKGHYNLGEKFYYNAWMPLPQPFKEEGV